MFGLQKIYICYVLKLRTNPCSTWNSGKLKELICRVAVSNFHNSLQLWSFWMLFHLKQNLFLSIILLLKSNYTVLAGGRKSFLFTNDDSDDSVITLHHWNIVLTRYRHFCKSVISFVFLVKYQQRKLQFSLF